MKEMQWKEKDGKLVLYVCDELTNEDWVYHRNHPLSLKECHPQHSDGWSTYQRLHKIGYTLRPTNY